jgi:hypothetical protein
VLPFVAYITPRDLKSAFDNDEELLHMHNRMQKSRATSVEMLRARAAAHSLNPVVLTRCGQQMYKRPEDVSSFCPLGVQNPIQELAAVLSSGNAEAVAKFVSQFPDVVLQQTLLIEALSKCTDCVRPASLCSSGPSSDARGGRQAGGVAALVATGYDVRAWRGQGTIRRSRRESCSCVLTSNERW